MTSPIRFAPATSHWRRLGGAAAAVVLVVVIGTVGYVLLGYSALDALYQVITTISTVGFREVEPLGPGGKVFTMAVILTGVGSTLYFLTTLVETFIEGRLNELLGRRRMQQSIASLHGHVVICGWGRVGRAIAAELVPAGRPMVVIDSDPQRTADIEHPVVEGDAAADDVLRAAGIERAAALVAAVDNDAGNSFIVLSARALNPSLFIVARARGDDSLDKLHRAGADRVVNPQRIGGARMAAFVVQPNVAEFLDVVMHDRSLDLRLEEVAVPSGSHLCGSSLREAQVRERTGALVLALRDPSGAFETNPAASTHLAAGQVLIAIGTERQLGDLAAYVEERAAP